MGVNVFCLARGMQRDEIDRKIRVGDRACKSRVL
jgi:hypothetical protein